MAGKKRIRDWAEPWTLVKSDAWRESFKTPPQSAASPEELRMAVAEWEAARARAERDADVMILGSRLAEPEVLSSLGGALIYKDDRRILTFSRLLGLPDGSPTHEEYAQRIVDSVNAMAGIGDPVAFMRELTAFLEDMARDPIDPFFNGRATRLLFKIPEHKDVIEKHDDSYDTD